METTDRYVKIVGQLTRLTVQREVSWARAVRTTQAGLDAEIYLARYNGRRFELMPRGFLAHLTVGASPWDGFSLAYRHVLISSAEDGSDQVVFPPSQAIENLAGLVKGQNMSRGLDDVERALGIA